MKRKNIVFLIILCACIFTGSVFAETKEKCYTRVYNNYSTAHVDHEEGTPGLSKCLTDVLNAWLTARAYCFTL